MRLHIPSAISVLLRRELRLAGSREIGGIIFGEHLDSSDFSIADISVQREGGTKSHFVREVAQHRHQIEIFFERTERDYARFNYLGEWHSHPSFDVVPSEDDIASMQRIVTDSDMGATFAILIIVRLVSWNHFSMSASVFLPNGDCLPVELIFEDADKWCRNGILARMRQWFVYTTLN